MTNKPPSLPLSSYDLLKTFAVIIMVIDHVGAYFYPDDLWWRVVGRVGFPIWFFLVGYASGRDISSKLMIGAFFLLGMNWIVGMSLLPLNALFTIIILRLIIDYIMAPIVAAQKFQWFVLALATILVLPSYAGAEYGTLALMFAMFGYMVRHKETARFEKSGVEAFFVTISVVFVGFQWFSFGFIPIEFTAMAVGTILAAFVLLNFKVQTFPALEQKMPETIIWFLKFCGKRTLEIYVVHLTLFKILALMFGMTGFGLFNFHIF